MSLKISLRHVLQVFKKIKFLVLRWYHLLLFNKFWKPESIWDLTKKNKAHILHSELRALLDYLKVRGRFWKYEIHYYSK